MTFTHNYTGTIDLDGTHSDIIDAYALAHDVHPCDVQDAISAKVLALPYAEETCFNHSSWIRLDFETDKEGVAAKRCMLFKRQLSAIFDAYRVQVE